MKNTVTVEEVKECLKDAKCTTIQLFDKPCTYVEVRMPNGFTIRDTTTCVDPANYDESIGKEICLKHIEDEVWKLLGFELQYEVSAPNRELASTRNMMISTDYKERFKAEYIQLRNRYNGLKKMLEVWDTGGLKFTPTCPRDMYTVQLDAMHTYLEVLKKRALLENVDVE